MADLITSQRFGTNVSYNDANKTLTIDLNDLTDTGDIIDGLGLDISGLNASNIDSYASKILHSLLLLNFQQQAVTNNDETVAVYVVNGGRRDITRNGVAQFSYVWQVNSYTPNTLPTNLDPDLMVS